MSNHYVIRCFIVRMALLVVLLVSVGGCTVEESGEKIYSRLEKGEAVDFNTLKCDQLDYLAHKFENRTDSVPNRLAEIKLAQAKKGC